MFQQNGMETSLCGLNFMAVAKVSIERLETWKIYYLNIHQHVWCVCTSYEGLEYESHGKTTAHQYNNPYDYKSSLALRFSLEI